MVKQGETILIKQPKQSPIPLVFCGALLPTAESSDADTIGTSGRLVVVRNNEENTVAFGVCAFAGATTMPPNEELASSKMKAYLERIKDTQKKAENERKSHKKRKSKRTELELLRPKSSSSSDGDAKPKRQRTVRHPVRQDETPAAPTQHEDHYETLQSDILKATGEANFYRGQTMVYKRFADQDYEFRKMQLQQAVSAREDNAQ